MKGLDGVAITDHYTLDGYFEARSVCRDLILIPGYEVCSDAGHLLVLGLELLPVNEEVVCYDEFVGWVRRSGGLVVLAHPAIEWGKLDRWISCKPDAVEVLNALYPSRLFVSKGLRVARRLGVPYVGGSDAHKPENVGDAYTVVEVEGNPDGENVLKAIKEGRTVYGGRLSPFRMRIKSGLRYILSKYLLLR